MNSRTRPETGEETRSAFRSGENLLYLTSNSRNISPLSGKSGEVFEVLERRFADGFYSFGLALSPNEIAEEFGVSQQPVRAALAQLRALGYVIITPQVGCRVASPSSGEINDFFLLFGRMEGVMAALAAVRHHSEEIEQLDTIGEQLSACVAGNRDDGMLDNYAALIGDWHLVVRKMARSDALAWRLQSFWRMSDFMLWQGAPNLEMEKLKLANRQRESIRDSIAARDAQTVEHLMAAHVRGKPGRVGIIEEGAASWECPVGSAL